MSERTRNGRQDRAVGERRPAAKGAPATPTGARQRRQAILGAVVGLVVVLVIVGSYVGFKTLGGEDGSAGTAAPSAAPGAAAEPSAAAPPAEPDSPAFPPLPDGADPALGSKPDAGRGEGELTELTATALIEGAGPAAAAGQNVTVNYVGVFYRTGEEFDASWNYRQPFSFQLGTGGVIPGWDRGLVGAKVGSRIQLDIPADLAYGDNPEGGRPAGPLRFIVDVLAVQ